MRIVIWMNARQVAALWARFLAKGTLSMVDQELLSGEGSLVRTLYLTIVASLIIMDSRKA